MRRCALRLSLKCAIIKISFIENKNQNNNTFFFYKRKKLVLYHINSLFFKYLALAIGLKLSQLRTLSRKIYGYRTMVSRKKCG